MEDNEAASTAMRTHSFIVVRVRSEEMNEIGGLKGSRKLRRIPSWWPSNYWYFESWSFLLLIVLEVFGVYNNYFANRYRSTAMLPYNIHFRFALLRTGENVGICRAGRGLRDRKSLR